MKIPFSPHPLQQFLFVDFFDDGHSDQCELIPHYSFDFHFSNNRWCWASLHVCLGLLRSSAQFLIGLFIFLILSCMSCLYILEITLLSVASFAIIFSHSEVVFSSYFIRGFYVFLDLSSDIILKLSRMLLILPWVYNSRRAKTTFISKLRRMYMAGMHKMLSKCLRSQKD